MHVLIVAQRLSVNERLFIVRLLFALPDGHRGSEVVFSEKTE